MAEKKNEVITFRTEEWVKTELQKVADYNKWSIAQTANQIIVNYLLNPRPEQITIRAEDLVKAAISIRKEGLQKGVEIAINLKETPETKTVDKYLEFRIIECGGLGCIDDFDPIKELSQDEIINIP